ncbi:TetR/AcrR family transcriptional regulator [Aquabacterium sp.]|uniref:TetR/AcrR family transcriptional regulator n=1 Tax=Aquabacterium sp. TaxID=1872578 RepID=UPI0039B76CCD
MADMERLSYKEQIQRIREDAIVEAVNRLLATKGYDAMTVDEVAAEAGMAKASVYKHFASKEDLAAAAMIRALDRAVTFVDGLRENPDARPIEQLKAVARWAITSQLEGEMPSLPSQNSALSNSLQANEAYMDRLISLSNKLSIWITEAQTSGELNPDLPAEMTLYMLFALACDPVVGMLKASGMYTNEQILAWVTTATFDGVSPLRAAAS